MNKTLPLCLALAFGSTLMQAKTPSKPANFSGNWVLDFSQTKDPPAGLEDYSMVVSQDDQQLKVQTSLRGDLQPMSGPNGQDPGSDRYPGGSPGGYPSRRGGGMGMPGRVGIGMPGGGIGMPGEGMPGGGMPGGGGRRPRAGSPSQGGIAAYTLYPHTAVYKLDGSESTAQVGDPMQSDATLKAGWAKDGEVLKLSLVGNGDSGQRGGKIQMKDQWKLSEDGQSLRVDRAVHSPEGSGTVHLVFHKRAADSSHSAAQDHKD